MVQLFAKSGKMLYDTQCVQNCRLDPLPHYRCNTFGIIRKVLDTFHMHTVPRINDERILTTLLTPRNGVLSPSALRHWFRVCTATTCSVNIEDFTIHSHQFSTKISPPQLLKEKKKESLNVLFMLVKNINFIPLNFTSSWAIISCSVTMCSDKFLKAKANISMYSNVA